MEMSEYMDRFKKGYRVSYQTGHDNLFIRVNPERTVFEIVKKRESETCKHCGSYLGSETVLTITFKSKQKDLTVFETSWLFMLWKENKIPMDYAGWHNCTAGKEFIANIKEVKI